MDDLSDCKESIDMIPNETEEEARKTTTVNNLNFTTDIYSTMTLNYLNAPVVTTNSFPNLTSDGNALDSLHSIIKRTSVANVQEIPTNSIVLVGYPYQRFNMDFPMGVGPSSTPLIFRNFLIENEFAFVVENLEYEVDLSTLSIHDCGDIPEKNKADELCEVVTQIVSNGSIPFVIGGTYDLVYPSTLGVFSSMEKREEQREVINIVIGSQVDRRLIQLGNPMRQQINKVILFGAEVNH